MPKTFKSKHRAPVSGNAQGWWARRLTSSAAMRSRLRQEDPGQPAEILSTLIHIQKYFPGLVYQMRHSTSEHQHILNFHGLCEFLDFLLSGFMSLGKSYNFSVLVSLIIKQLLIASISGL